MNRSQQNRSRRGGTFNRRCPRPLSLLCLLAGLGSALGQQVLAPRPEMFAAPTSMRQVNEATAAGNDSDGFFTGLWEGTIPLKYGPVTLRPSATYDFSYGDGIQANPGQQENTIIQTFTPNFLFLIGNHWLLNYSPTWAFYSSDEFDDTFGQYVNLNGTTTYEDWTFGLTQSYRQTSDPQAQTGTQTDEQNIDTELAASYSFNSKMSVDMGVSQNFELADDDTGSKQWSTMEWFNYRFWARFQGGIGAGVGYVDEDTGSDSTFERYQGRINWQPTDKIGIEGHGGVEVRQFSDSNADQLVNPIYGMTVTYQPLEFTRLSINAERTVDTSYFQDDITEETSINANLNQRLLGKLNLNLGGSYSKTKYISTTTGSSTGRDDDYYTFNVSLGRTIYRRATIAINYQWSQNESSDSGYGYTSSQIGFTIGYRY